MNGTQPGQVYSPRQEPDGTSDAGNVNQEVTFTIPRSSSDPVSPAQLESVASPSPTEPEPQGFYKSEPLFNVSAFDDLPQDSIDDELPESVSWTASEFVHHAKSPMWFVILFGGTLALCAVVYLLTKDLITVVTILIMAALFAVVAARKPNVQQYVVDRRGLQIGPKLWEFKNFKSFCIIDEGHFTSVTLLPLKRFMPSVSVYFDPEDEAKIVDMLALYLPYEARQPDITDRIMKRIKF